MASINRALREGEAVHNAIRPDRSLDKKTPAEYLRRYHPGMARKPKLSDMS